MTSPSCIRLSLICCVLVSVVIVEPARGQTTAASLTGTIRDASGSVVPGANVTIVNAATEAVSWEGTTDENGNYLAPSLPVGTYNVTVSLQGFKTIATRGLRLEVSQRARLDNVLELGQLDETITVVGAAEARLETEDSSMGLVIDTSQVQGLPLPGRNVLNLADVGRRCVQRRRGDGHHVLAALDQWQPYAQQRVHDRWRLRRLRIDRCSGTAAVDGSDP